MVKTLKGIESSRAFAQDVFMRLSPSADRATLIGLSGELGSGKTTFTQGLANALGVAEDVLSPTFVLAKYYPIPNGKWKELVHIDAYRIEDPEEINVLGWERLLLSPDRLVVVEWPEHLDMLFPQQAKMIRFEFIDEETRSGEEADI